MRRIIFSILFVMYATLALCQQNFQRIMVEDGLINNIVFGAVQDNKNFMWFATMSGIDRYDGKYLVHYQLPNGTSGQTTFNYGQVINIVKDSRGQLWTSTSSRLYKYNAILDRFEIAINYPDVSISVSNLFADSFNGIWIGTNKDRKSVV